MTSAPTIPDWPRTLDAVLRLPSVALEDRDTLPRASGLYFVVVNDQRLVYVGATSDLRDRWRRHHRMQRISLMGRARIAYLLCEYGVLLARAEEAAIRQFWPPLNGETRWRDAHGEPPLPEWPTVESMQPPPPRPPPPPAEEVLTLPTAACELGISHVTLFRWVKAGKLPTLRFGTMYGVRRADLDAFKAIKRPLGRPRKDRDEPHA